MYELLLIFEFYNIFFGAMNPENISGLPIEILVVEDNPGDFRLFLEEFKEIRLSANFHHFSNGVDAMAFLRHEGDYVDVPMPDLVVMDLYLPRMSGYEILTEIDNDVSLNGLPIVVFSTLANGDVITRDFVNIDNLIFIHKPESLEDYDRVIERVEDFWYKTRE